MHKGNHVGQIEIHFGLGYTGSNFKTKGLENNVELLLLYQNFFFFNLFILILFRKEE